jgi:hypothetical protein
MAARSACAALRAAAQRVGLQSSLSGGLRFSGLGVVPGSAASAAALHAAAAASRTAALRALVEASRSRPAARQGPLASAAWLSVLAATPLLRDAHAAAATPHDLRVAAVAAALAAGSAAACEGSEEEAEAIKRRFDELTEDEFNSLRCCDVHGVPWGGQLRRGPKGGQVTWASLPKHGALVCVAAALPARR